MQEVETTQTAEGLTVDPPVEPTAPVETQASGETDAATSEPESVESAASLKFGFTDDPVELLDHDEVKPHIQRRVDRIANEEKTKLTQAFNTFKAEVEAGAFFRELDGNIAGLRQMYENGNEEGSIRALGQLDKLAEKFSPAMQQKIENDGFTNGAAAQTELMRNAIMGKLDERGKDRVMEMFTSSSATWDEVLDTLTAHKTRPLEEKVKALEVENERLKAGVRSAERPNLGQGSGAGSKSITSMADADRRYTLPPGHPDHITHEEYKSARERFGSK